MLAQEVVVDDQPAMVFGRRYARADDLDGGIRVDQQDFPAS
jgi:hypothetical protein